MSFFIQRSNEVSEFNAIHCSTDFGTNQRFDVHCKTLPEY